MQYNKKTDMWTGTPIEHLQKLLDTHDCMCDKVIKVIQAINQFEKRLKEELCERSFQPSKYDTKEIIEKIKKEVFGDLE